MLDPRFELLTTGDERTARNMVGGEWHGAEISLADYAYRDSARRRHLFSIAKVELQRGDAGDVNPVELGLPEGWSVEVTGSAAYTDRWFAPTIWVWSWTWPKPSSPTRPAVKPSRRPRLASLG
jgi:hypothetical protein